MAHAFGYFFTLFNPEFNNRGFSEPNTIRIAITMDTK
jgi:hypothetical protein